MAAQGVAVTFRAVVDLVAGVPAGAAVDVVLLAVERLTPGAASKTPVPQGCGAAEIRSVAAAVPDAEAEEDVEAAAMAKETIALACHIPHRVAMRMRTAMDLRSISTRKRMQTERRVMSKRLPMVRHSNPHSMLVRVQ